RVSPEYLFSLEGLGYVTGDDCWDRTAISRRICDLRNWLEHRVGALRRDPCPSNVHRLRNYRQRLSAILQILPLEFDGRCFVELQISCRRGDRLARIHAHASDALRFTYANFHKRHYLGPLACPSHS